MRCDRMERGSGGRLRRRRGRPESEEWRRRQQGCGAVGGQRAASAKGYAGCGGGAVGKFVARGWSETASEWPVGLRKGKDGAADRQMDGFEWISGCRSGASEEPRRRKGSNGGEQSGATVRSRFGAANETVDRVSDAWLWETAGSEGKAALREAQGIEGFRAGRRETEETRVSRPQ